MISIVTRDAIQIQYAPSVLVKVDSVIDKNLNNSSQVALFISRLIKGFQNLTNEDLIINSSFGKYTYEIEDIGVVLFSYFFNPETGISAFVIDDIYWTFPTSRFFSSFVE